MTEAHAGATPTEKRLQLFYEAGRRFGASLDPVYIYRNLLELVREAMPIDGIAVSSYDSEDRLIRCEYVWSGANELDPSALPPLPLGPDGSGMQSRVIRSGKPLKFDVEAEVKAPGSNFFQVDSEGSMHKVDEASPPASRSALMVPMKLEGRVTGVVQIMSDQPDAYSDDDLSLLEGLVLQMSAPARNAGLYETAQKEIEDRRRAERLLQESRTFVDRIINASPDAIYIFDLIERRMLFTSEQSFALLGYAADEITDLGQDGLLRFLHPDDQSRLREMFSRWQTAADGDVLEIEYRIRHKDGRWRWFLNRDTVFARDADGKVTQLLGIAGDITARKEAEDAVREREQLFRLIVDAMPTIAWFTDSRGLTTYVNRWYYDFTGLPPTTPGPEGWDLVVHPDDKPAAFQAFERSLKVGAAWDVQLRLRRADGEYRWHLSRQVPMQDESGEIRNWIGTSTEIHAQKAAEAELESRVLERTSQLEAALRELEGFTYTVSHDLRAPLRAIGSTSMILMEDFGEDLPEEAKLQLTRQAENAKRLGVLIDELLKLSRISRQEVLRSDFDLSEMAHGIITELAGCKCRFEIQPALTANGDPKLLRLVLFNLIENACKFSPGGGTVALGRGDDGSFFVRDEGIGFDMQYQNKLFLPFERLVRDDEFPGTGIGLANVHRIVQRHGGKVWAESELGHGSTFSFTLGKPEG